MVIYIGDADLMEGSVVMREMHYLSEDEMARVENAVCRYHNHSLAAHECSSVLVQRVRAPISVVWSLVRRFDEPQSYKHFIRSCSTAGDVRVGSTREVTVISGLPAKNSTERLEILDEEEHVLSFRVLGGDHRLRNYRSVTTLHETAVDGRPATIVVESYVVDVTEGNTKEDTCTYTDTLVKCNLGSLARTSEHLTWHTGRHVCLVTGDSWGSRAEICEPHVPTLFSVGNLSQLQN
ncbi:hypothetical protein O6H91_23G039000 [Diphasiastrum complanatum]|uniref:Uncharacterized protein n=1 Tax=Diphasiastrum complanatum TaxID=34168 RepID=A0ACC2A9U6_DIPCM|nr:hypothetical protein O6H91_23G039000 [Diphasiastrum complanatum]